MEQKQKKYLYVIYMVRYLRHLRHSRCHKSGTEKNFYIYINIYIYKFAKTRILRKYRSIPCIFTDF